MNRLPDWLPRLAAYIASVRGAPFAYGSFDCALFAAGAVEAMTGVDLSEGLRGKYTTAPDGAIALARQGFMSPVDLAATHFARVTAAQLQVGDIAVVDTPDGPALGVVQGGYIYVAAPTGLGIKSLLDARMGFRV